MRHLIVIIITLMIQPIYIKGDNNQLYKQLDAALAQRAHYVELKEKSLNEIKQGAKYVTSNEDKLKLYEQLANEYKAYEYDSAMTYVNKGLILAQKNNNILFNKRFQLSHNISFQSVFTTVFSQFHQRSMPNQLRQVLCNFRHNLTV